MSQLEALVTWSIVHTCTCTHPYMYVTGSVAKLFLWLSERLQMKVFFLALARPAEERVGGILKELEE